MRGNGQRKTCPFLFSPAKYHVQTDAITVSPRIELTKTNYNESFKNFNDYRCFTTSIIVLCSYVDN